MKRAQRRAIIASKRLFNGCQCSLASIQFSKGSNLCLAYTCCACYAGDQPTTCHPKRKSFNANSHQPISYKRSSLTMPLVFHSSTTCISSHETPCRDSKSACPSGECHGFKPCRSSERVQVEGWRVSQMIIYGYDSASLRPCPGNPTCLESLESLESMGCVFFGRQNCSWYARKALASFRGPGRSRWRW